MTMEFCNVSDYFTPTVSQEFQEQFVIEKMLNQLKKAVQCTSAGHLQKTKLCKTLNSLQLYVSGAPG